MLFSPNDWLVVLLVVFKIIMRLMKRLLCGCSICRTFDWFSVNWWIFLARQRDCAFLIWSILAVSQLPQLPHLVKCRHDSKYDASLIVAFSSIKNLPILWNYANFSLVMDPYDLALSINWVISFLTSVQRFPPLSSGNFC